MERRPPAPIDSDQHQPSVLIEAEALYFAGPWARTGRLVLTTQSLEHHPTGKMDKMVGADRVAIPVDIIDHIELSFMQKTLEIHASGRRFRFGGKGAVRIHGRLSALLDERDGTTDPGSAFVSGERVVLHGPAERFVAGPLGTRGHLTLTDLRLRFEAGTGLEQLLWSDVGFDIMLESITGVSLHGVRQKLRVHTTEGPLDLGGAIVPRFYAHLVSRTSDPTQPTAEPTSAEGTLLASWEATLRNGPIEHTIYLDVTPFNLHVRPRGKLGTVVGQRPFTIPLRSVERVTMQGWPDRRIRLLAQGQDHILGLPDPVERYDDIVHRLRQALHLLSQDRAADLIADARQSWGEKQGWSQHPVLIAEPALRRHGDRDWEVGMVVVTQLVVAFCPFAKSAKTTGAFHSNIDALQRAHANTPSEIDTLRLRTQRRLFVFRPVSGKPFIRAFWKRVRPPARIIEWENVRDRTRARFDGVARYVRLSVEGRRIVDERPAYIILRPDGWATVVPESVSSRLERAPNIEVELGLPEGVYEFSVRPQTVQPTPRRLQGTAARKSVLLLTSLPRSLRVYNARARFRVPVDTAAMCSSEGKDPSGRSLGKTEFRIRIEDISTLGLGIRSPLRLNLDTNVEISMRLDGVDFALSGRVIREDPPSSGSLDRRYAIRLQDLTDGETEDLHRIVMTRQRALLVSQQDDPD